MENNKRCKNCGAQLLSQEKVCPVCNTSVLENNDVKEKNYWFSKKIWIIFLGLVILTGFMSSYTANHPIDYKEETEKQNTVNEAMKVDKQTNIYSQATNINGLGYSYVNENGIYIVANNKLYLYDHTLSSKQEFLDTNLTDFNETKNSYYYLDESNNYYEVNKEDKTKKILLNNVFYVHHLGDMIYYQNDSDGETIHCFNLSDNSDYKISNEPSYNLIVDQDKKIIFYMTSDQSLISIGMDGSNRKQLAQGIKTYTYDGEFLYGITNEGLIKIDINGEVDLIYENSQLEVVNMVNEMIVVQDQNVIYTMTSTGKEVKKLYTMDLGGQITFEIVGDKILVLARGMSDSNITYEVIGLDGKRQLLDTDDLSSGIGFEL